MPLPEESQKKINLKEQEQLELEEEKRKALINEENTKKLHGKETLLKPLESGSIWEMIVSEYKNQFNKEPEKDDCLAFPSRASAEQFFEGMAKKNVPFLLAELDASRKSTGFYMYSCGNGKLFQGSLTSIHKEMAKALEQNRNDVKLEEGLKRIEEKIAAETKNPASTMREALGAMKDKQEKKPDESLSPTLK